MLVTKKTAGKAYQKFDPEGNEYDYQTADKVIKKYPLTKDKPAKFEGDEVGDDNSFERWVYHPELKDYKKHGASFDPETGMLLKGIKHESFNKTKAVEDKLGNEIIKGKDGRYYSRKKTIKVKKKGSGS